MDPACLKRCPLGQAHSDPQFRLEQDATAEGNAVGAVELVVRSGVDGDAEARPNENPLAKFRGQAEGGIMGLSGRVGRGKGVWLERGSADAVPAVAELDIRAGLDPAPGQEGVDVMDVEAAEQFPGRRGSRRKQGAMAETISFFIAVA